MFRIFEIIYLIFYFLVLSNLKVIILYYNFNYQLFVEIICLLQKFDKKNLVFQM